jgi:diketogulonate reductase-like aldo/keto reductase
MAEKNIITQAYASLTCGITLNSESVSVTESVSESTSAESTSTSAESTYTASSEYLKSTMYEPDQLLLGWATHYNLRPIPTAHKTDHLIKNFKTMKEIKLDQTHVEKLDQITEIVCNYKQHADKINL